MMGKIQRCPDITQARFIRLCCLYWNKQCELTYEDAEIEIDKEHIDILISKRVVVSQNGVINISFLDEQFAEIEGESEGKKTSGIIGNLKRWHRDIYEQYQAKKISLEQAQEMIKQARTPIADPSHPDSTPIADPSQSIAEKKRTEQIRLEEEKKRTEQTIFSPIVEDVFYFCLDYFPDNLHPKTQKEIDSWKTTIKQLHEIDGHDYDTIRHLIQKTREDDFWSKNFLSVNKLRKNDKNGVKYFDVFFEKFKIGNNGKQTTDFAHLIRISEQFRKKPNVG
jgi:hypothetical protein